MVGTKHVVTQFTQVRCQAIGVDAQRIQPPVAAGIAWPRRIDGLLQVIRTAAVLKRPRHIAKDDAVHVGILAGIRLTAVDP